MRRTILIVTVFALSMSCKLNKKPEFLRINKINVVSADLNTVVLKADAVFMNHNNLGGKLQTDNIDVFVDENLIAKVSSEAFKVPSKEEFTIPLSVNFNTSELLQSENNSLLGALAKQFLNKEVTVRFKGELTYIVAGFKASYPIDHIEDIQIK